MITPLGNSQWQRWKFRNLFDSDKKSAGYQATGLDITELKKLEQKVAKSAEEIENFLLERKVEIQDLNKQIYNEIASHEKTHFQLQFTQFAMDNASYMITWIGREGRFVYMNKEAQKVLGYQYRDVISKKFIDIFAGVFSFPWDEVWETIKKDQQYTLETALMTSRGKEIPVEMVLNYLEFKDKQYCCVFARDISEKKQAENALRESEEKYRVIFNNEIYSICIFDFDTLELLDVNNAYTQMYGYSRDELLSGMTLHDITAEHDASDSSTKIARKEGTLFIPLRYHKKKNGTIFPVEIVGGPYEWKGKQVMFVLSHDITERLMAENALRESEEKYRQLVDLAQEGIWAIDAVEKTTYVNPRMAEMLGYTVEEMLGAHLFSFMDDAGKTIAAKNIESRRQGIKEDHEFEFITKGGNRIDAALSTSPIKDEMGIYKGALAVVSDITHHKRAVAALRHREHDFTSLVENAADMIVRFDCDLHYVYCNPAVERQLGIPFYQLRGKTPLEFGTSVEQSRFIDASLRKTLETGIAQEVEQSVSTPSGIRHFQTRIVPEHDPDGSIVSLLAITRDITEHKLNEDNFRQKTYQQLQASYETLQKTEADLRLHQTEQEVQNEELRLAQRNLEVSRQRYFELYDLAPSGYLTLSEDGLILNANLTVATMLGVERQQLGKKAVSKYIVKDDQDIFYRCRKDLVKTGERQSCELRMLDAGGLPFRAYVVAVPAQDVDGDKAAISLMLIDIDGRKTAGNGT